MLHKYHKRAISFTMALVLVLTVLVTIGGSSEDVYGVTGVYGLTGVVPIQQGTLVIPVSFKKENPAADPAIMYCGTWDQPKLLLRNDINRDRYYSYKLNDIFNSSKSKAGRYTMGNFTVYRHTYLSNVNDYVKRASFGLLSVNPIYYKPGNVTSTGAVDKFLPIQLDCTPGAVMTNGRRDSAKMIKELGKVIAKINNEKLLSPDGFIKYYPELSQSKDEVVKDIKIGEQIDNVLFLVDASDGIDPNPYGLHAFSSIRSSAKYVLKSAPTSNKGSLTLNIGTMQVAFIEKDFECDVIHETMHVKGVNDLYIKSPTPGADELTPAGLWDIQSTGSNPSGPYFTQRFDLDYLSKGGINKDHVSPDDFYTKELTGNGISVKVDIQDINSISADEEKDWRDIYNKAVKRVGIMHDTWGVNECVDYWIEYRHSKTDYMANVLDYNNGFKDKKGYLLLYTTFQRINPTTKKLQDYIYLLKAFKPNETISVETYFNTNVQQGVIGINDKLTPESYKITWTLKDPVIKKPVANSPGYKFEGSFEIKAERISESAIEKVDYL